MLAICPKVCRTEIKAQLEVESEMIRKEMGSIRKNLQQEMASLRKARKT